MAPTEFSYLVITKSAQVRHAITALSVGNELIHNQEGFVSFWSKKPCEEIDAVLRQSGHDYALMQVSNISYQAIDGALASVLQHIK